MSNQSITSLAILKVNWDERHVDYLESFLPLFLNLIRTKQYNEIIAGVVREDFQNEYGLSIPHHPIMAILGRLRSRGFIIKKIEGFIPDYTKINNDDNFDTISQNQKRKLKKLVLKIIDFGANQGIVLSEEIAEGALLGFFKENDLGMLFATSEKSALPDATVSKSIKFLIAKFIYSAKESEPELFEFIVDIAIGSALAGAMIYGKELTEHFGGRMKNLNLYLDSGYVFSILGVDGEENKVAFEELTQNLHKDGAKIKIFEHTYDEIMGIFTSALYWMKQGNYELNKASRTLKYFVTNEFTETGVEMFIAQIPGIIEKFAIEKVPKPKYSEDIHYQIGESQLKAQIIEAYKLDDPFFDEDYKEDTMNRDIDSVYSICKLRKGKTAFTLRDASHIFVTTNALLAKISSRVQSSDNVPFSFPPCITAIFIGTLAWLQNPAQATKINEKKIMADAYAAIQPDSQLIKKYLGQIEILKKNGEISDNEYYTLRTNNASFNYLSAITNNDINNFGPKTTTQILDEINQEHMSSLKSKLQEEKESHKITTESLSEREHIIERKSERIHSLENKYEKILSLVVNVLVWTILPILIAVIFSAIIINSFSSFIHNLEIKIVAAIIIVIIALVPVSIKKTRVWLREKIKTQITKKF